MKIKTFFYSLIFLFCGTFVFAQGQTAKTEGPKTNEDFRALIQRYYDAWKTLDLDRAGGFYAKDADPIFMI